MSKNNETDLDVVPPDNANRALELLRQVREIQKRVRSFDADGNEDTFDNANQLTGNDIGPGIFESLENEIEIESNSPSDFAFPETLSRFKIEKLIGEGGFARVFLAHDPKLDRKVALKVPKLGAIADVGSRERFDREARSAGILSHPSIVPVFESGNVGPLSYIAYEYCDGETLADWIFDQEGELPVSQAAKIVEQLAYAVEHAHQRNIIHRDLKPANILVSDAGREKIPNLRITDFGLAKNYQQTDSFETVEGAIVGTPAYMSPEQALGQAEVSKQSDVYSLGVIFYELLTGKLPFEKGNPIQTLHAVANDIPVPPSRTRKNVPADLEAVCLKCIEKDPVKRYPSAFELARDLRSWSKGFGVTARHPTTPERIATWCKRNPGITTAFVGVTIGLGVAMYQWNHAIQQTTIANQAAQQAQRNIKLSQETIKSMVTDICTSSSIEQKFGRKLLVKAIDLQKRLIDESSSDPEILLDTGYLHLKYSTELTNSLDLEQAIIALDAGLEAIAELKTNDVSVIKRRDALSIAIWMHKAVVQSMLGRHDDARASLQFVDRDRADLPAAGQASALSREAITLAQQERMEEAWLKIQESIVLLRSDEPKNDFEKLMRDGSLAGSHFWKGKIEYELKQFRQAEQTFIEGQRLIEPVLAMASTHESISMESTRMQRGLGRTQFKLGKFAESRINMNEAALSYDSMSETYPQTPRYGLFAFQLRLDLIGLELETKNWLAARKLVLRLNEDYWQTPFDKFDDHSDLYEAKELIRANLRLAKEFDTSTRFEFATEHKDLANSWIEFVKKEHPNDSEIETFELELNSLAKRD